MWRVLVLLLIAPSAFAVPITPVPVYTDNQGREWLDVRTAQLAKLERNGERVQLGDRRLLGRP